MSRRDVLVLGAAVPLAAFVRQPRRSGTLRLAVVGDLPAEARQGLELGIREATQTARLIGRQIAMTDDPRGAAGIISGSGEPVAGAAGQRIVIAITPLARESECTFSVAASDTRAAALLKKWTAENGERPGLSIAEWHPALSKFGASELNERFTAAFGRPMTAPAWRGWFAVKALAETTLRSTGVATCSDLRAARFDGHKGRPLAFGSDGVLEQPLYVVSGDAVLGEVS